MRGGDTEQDGLETGRRRDWLFWGSTSLAVLPWWLLALAIADWVALRTGSLRHPAGLLAVLVALTALVFVLRLGQLAGALVRRSRPIGASLAETLLLAGVLAALSAGSLNWLFGLQGFVVLHSGEAAPIHGGSHLQDFQRGPLASFEEMDLVLGLREVELIPIGGGSFYPESHLFLQGRSLQGRDPGADGGESGIARGESGHRELTVSPWASAAAGPLRFHQGAFGFAPRIVLLHDDETVFDRTVPFTTERRGTPGAGPSGVSFQGHFTVAEKELDVRGEVDLASLDEGLRGHATLRLEVRRENRLLGRGELRPGRFAELAEDWRVGFAGLSRWSEIDISRRTYGGGVLAGGGLALAGLLLWPLARWRGW